MCFRPPSAEAGEMVCPGCYMLIEPDAEGKCPECGAVMKSSLETPASAAPTAPHAPAPPDMPSVPGSPEKPATE